MTATAATYDLDLTGLDHLSASSLVALRRVAAAASRRGIQLVVHVDMPHLHFLLSTIGLTTATPSTASAVA